MWKYLHWVVEVFDSLFYLRNTIKIIDECFFFNLGRLVWKCDAGMSEKGVAQNLLCGWSSYSNSLLRMITAASPQVVPGTPCLARFSEDDTIYRFHKFEITRGLLVTQKNTGQLCWNGTVPWRKSITWIMGTVKVFPWEASFQCRLVSLPLRCCPLDAGRLW